MNTHIRIYTYSTYNNIHIIIIIMMFIIVTCHTKINKDGPTSSGLQVTLQRKVMINST